MKKVPYELLAFQLEELYAVPIDPKDIRAIEEHCEMIAQFVENSGWELNEFIQESLKDFLPPNLSKMN